MVWVKHRDVVGLDMLFVLDLLINLHSYSVFMLLISYIIVSVISYVIKYRYILKQIKHYK